MTFLTQETYEWQAKAIRLCASFSSFNTEKVKIGKGGGQNVLR